MSVKHPESDVRTWLAENAERVDVYTRRRIEASYSFIDDLLAGCEGMEAGAAFDVGSGAGFDTFAIGRYFDAVRAIDTNPAAIDQARRIARGAGVAHITFQRDRIESLRGALPWDFVYCNLMSHNVSSRCSLMDRLRRDMRPRTYLSYAEITEGYGPMEIHRAIRRRDGVELASRIRQVLRGFTGQPGFRFFLAGSAGPLLEAAGMRVLACESSRWNGMVIHERTLSRAEGLGVGGTSGGDPDYARLTPDFATMRVRVRRLTPGGSGGRLSAGARAEIESALRDPCDGYAPFLMCLRMADMVLPSFRLQPSPIQRLGAVWQGARRRLGCAADRSECRTDLDWSALEDLDLAFIAVMRRNAGLPAGVIDE